MQLQPITGINQIKKGDTIVLTGGKYTNKAFSVPHVKVSDQDGKR